MLVHAAHLPHSPLLVPEVHTEDAELLARTRQAVEEIAQDLYTLKPTVIVLVSGHEQRYTDAFGIDLAPEHIADLRPFGDLTEPTRHPTSMRLADTMQRQLRRQHVPLTLTTHPSMDYGAAVAVRLLRAQGPLPPILPISYSDMAAKDHLQFGQSLRDVFEHSDERIALISTGDLSHCLDSTAPGGFCEEGRQFDALVQDALSQSSTSALLNIDNAVIEKAQESAYRPLLILMGAIDKTRHQTEILSYEAPFGVGYLVAQFHLR